MIRKIKPLEQDPKFPVGGIAKYKHGKGRVEITVSVSSVNKTRTPCFSGTVIEILGSYDVGNFVPDWCKDCFILEQK